MEENYTPVNSEATEAKLCKSWSFTEKNNKHTTYHTFTIQGKRFSHQTELKEAAQSYRQRTDFNLDNVYAVHSYYGVTRNLVGTIILAVLAVVSAILAIVNFVGGGDSHSPYDSYYKVAPDPAPAEFPVAGVIFLVIAAALAFFAYLVYKKIKPSFILEIQTVIPNNGKIIPQNFTFGTPSVNFGKQAMNPLLMIVLIVLWPIGILYLLTQAKGNKYKFEMDEATGLEIVDTIGAYLIKE